MWIGPTRPIAVDSRPLGFCDIDSDNDPPKSLYIDPDTAGNLLELLYLQLDDDLIIHAMPLRPVFRTYLTGEDS